MSKMIDAGKWKPRAPEEDVTGGVAGSTYALTSHGRTEDGRLSLIAYHRDGAEVITLAAGKRQVVGRTEPSDLVVPDRSLSRQHARFGLLGDEVVVEDLGSTNGTWIAGRPVAQEVVRPGDVVMLGAVRVVVQALGGRPRLGLEGHDAFVSHVMRELTRAQFTGRGLALVMVRAQGHEVSLDRWAPQAMNALRAIDLMALYGGNTVELLLPEADADEARKGLVRVAEATSGSLRFGVAVAPGAGATVDQLIDAARSSLHKASSERPIVVSDSAVAGVPSSAPRPSAMIADAPAMQSLMTVAQRVARGNIPVLIHGETGTGKEVLARFIHDAGPRSNSPLVAVNCAAIPPQLVESTLFGHRRGSFTGAEEAREGVFEAADGGTVLLDEIGDLPLPVQAALLRVLENRAVMRVGSTQETSVDVRIVAASHRDLEAMVMAGTFREDLLYRLNAVTLEIPPLRERREDIDRLVELFLPIANERNGTSVEHITDEARAQLNAFDWPGNIRQLRNVVERAVVVAADDQVTPADLPRPIQAGGAEAPARAPVSEAAENAENAEPAEKAEPGPSTESAKLLRHVDETFRECMERLESEVLLQALDQTGGNQSEAARRLQMPRRTLVHKVKVLGLRDGEGRR